MSEAELREASAQLVLLQGVSLLHPEDAVFEAMIEGWGRQQRGGADCSRTRSATDRAWCGASPSTPTPIRGSGRRPISTSG